MKLTAYALIPNPLPLRAAPATRAWMNESADHHAYRCLPLTIANGHGWEVLSPCAFEVTWNGGENAADLSLRATDGFAHFSHYAVSHFAQGIVTFHLTYLFRTDPGWNLFATGPTNRPKDGICALSGLIETDWLPYPFTMNWKMTRPGVVRFEKNEPLCLLYPVAADALTATEPEILNLDEAPDLKAQMDKWRAQRDDFMRRFEEGDAATLKEAWQRFYFTGQYPDGSAPAARHVHKLKLAAFVDKRDAHERKR